jgi:hypothetical protein
MAGDLWVSTIVLRSARIFEIKFSCEGGRIFPTAFFVNGSYRGGGPV